MSAQVQYVLGENGHLDIRPSGKNITVNGDSGDGTLASKNINVSNQFALGSTTTLTLGTLTGTVQLGESGAVINSVGNKITNLTSLSGVTITSGDVNVTGNNITGVSSLNSNEITSNNFSVSHNVDTTTAATNVMTLTKRLVVGDVSKATLSENTLTGLASLDSTTITSGNVNVSSNNISGVGTVTSGHFTDGIATLSSGNLNLNEGSITNAKIISLKPSLASTITAGSGKWMTAVSGDNTLTGITSISSTTITDTVATLSGGSLTSVQDIDAIKGTIGNGTIGDMTLVSSGMSGVGSLTMKTDGLSKILNVSSLSMSSLTTAGSTITNGAGKWMSPMDDTKNTLSGVTEFSATTITDGNATLLSGNLTGVGNLVASTSTITSGTIAGVEFLTNDVSGVGTLTATDIEVGTATFRDNTGVPEITGLGSFSCATITDGVTTLKNGSLTSVTSLAGTDATISNATLTTLAVGTSATLTGNNLTGLSSLNSTNIDVGTPGNAISLRGGTRVIENVTQIQASTVTSAFTGGSVELANGSLTGLADATLTGNLKAGDIVAASNNITGVNQLNLTKLVASGDVIATGEIKHSAGQFVVSHDLDTTETTVTSKRFTDGTLTVREGTIASLAELTGTTATLTTANLAGITLSGNNITGVTELQSGSISMQNNGTISGGGEVSAGVLKATLANGESVISGNLRVEGDLKVVNNSAKVIELQHEKFSTQDPVLEFNIGLSDPAVLTAVNNPDFGFVNVCKDSNSVLKSAGLVSKVTASDNMEFTFFHSGAYTSGGTNNTLPAATDYTTANVKCKNVTSDGIIIANDATSYIAVGPVLTGRGTEVLYANGNMKATGFIESTNGFKSTGGTINIGNATQDDAKIRCDGTIKTLSLTTQNFTQTSDARKKENVKTIEDSVATLEKLRPVTFDWKEGGKSDVGFIAQEVKEVYPELVAEDATGHYSVAYTGLVAPLVRAVQQQQEMIRALEARLAKLEA